MDLLILIVLILTGADPTAEGAATPTIPTANEGGDTVRKSPIG
jgi:hypothetical protein